MLLTSVYTTANGSIHVRSVPDAADSVCRFVFVFVLEATFDNTDSYLNKDQICNIPPEAFRFEFCCVWWLGKEPVPHPCDIGICLCSHNLEVYVLKLHLKNIINIRQKLINNRETVSRDS